MRSNTEHLIIHLKISDVGARTRGCDMEPVLLTFVVGEQRLKLCAMQFYLRPQQTQPVVWICCCEHIAHIALTHKCKQVAANDTSKYLGNTKIARTIYIPVHAAHSHQMPVHIQFSVALSL